jgi:hypothetical protein
VAGLTWSACVSILAVVQHHSFPCMCDMKMMTDLDYPNRSIFGVIGTRNKLTAPLEPKLVANNFLKIKQIFF